MYVKGNIMKRACGIVLCIVLFMFCLMSSAIFAADEESDKHAFSLVIRRGAGSFGIGDLNTTLTSMDGYYDWLREVYPNDITGSFSEASGHFEDWEAEIQWVAWKGLSIGLALSGPVHINNKGSISFLYGWTSAESIESEVRTKAPIKFNLYYSLPVFSKVDLAISSGIGLYNARMLQNMHWLYRYLDDTDTVGSYVFNVTGKTMGYHCGVVLEYKFDDRFSMLAEAQLRFAKIKSLKGSGTYAERRCYVAGGNIISEESDTQEGYLYHYYEDMYGVYFMEALQVFSDPSAIEAYVTELRKATLDLNGFTFKIGLKIGLF
jgi:hypothetical protein